MTAIARAIPSARTESCAWERRFRRSSAEIWLIKTSLTQLSEEEVIINLQNTPRNDRLFLLINTLRNHYKIGLLSNVGRDIVHALFSDAERELFDVFAHIPDSFLVVFVEIIEKSITLVKSFSPPLFKVASSKEIIS